MLTTM